MNRFFHEVIEPCLQSLPVLQVVHFEHHNGREFQLMQTVSRNVYTDFDRCLSRHLAATTGEAFPAYTITVEVEGAQTKGKHHHLVSGFQGSVPHAVKEITERAFERAGPIELTFHRCSFKRGHDPSVAHKRKIAARDIEQMRAALAICADLGDGEFLDISGDFGVIIAKPPGTLDPVIMHLNNGTVLVPSSSVAGSATFQWPIYAFAEHAATNLAAQSYLVNVGQAIIAEKESALREFRSAAERRVIDLHRALNGRRLQSHWLELADGLIARLREGLGDSLIGISDDARGIALDLVEAIESEGGACIPLVAAKPSTVSAGPRASALK